MSDLVSTSRVNSQHLPTSRVVMRRDGWLAVIGVAGIFLMGVWWFNQVHGGIFLGRECAALVHSRWSTFFGMPLAAFAMVYYAAILGLSITRWAPAHQQGLRVVSGMGCVISAYLVAVIKLELDVYCTWWTVSGALVTISWLLLLGRMAWWQRVIAGAVGACVGLSVIGTVEAALRHPADTYAQGLATHFAQSDAHFYGAAGCPHCWQQKMLFGDAAKSLPYIECSPQRPSAPQALNCESAGITRYPIWVFSKQQYAGVLSLAELARLSRYMTP